MISKLKKNLILTGMMGVGKTTIGKKLAGKLDYKFIDIDKKIEQKEQSTISNIFKVHGEIYFRKIENEITLTEIKRDKSVISLGGGSFINPKIRNEIKLNTLSFWLDVDINLLASRVARSKKRPLLINKNIKETMKKIYLMRKRSYSEAHFKINCNSLTIDKIVNKILGLYESTAD